MLTLLLAAALTAERPNVVFLLVDDLGWADLGCYGSTFHETPHVDALAASGMRFTQGYAACPVCSPTRASILTGRHPVRVDITDWIPGMKAGRVADGRFGHVQDRDGLASSEVTLAEALGGAGYRTFFAGKWHLGDKGHWPTDQGFDVNVGGNAQGSPPGGYYAPWKNPTLQAAADGEYLTERLTDEAVAFLRQPGGRPFLLFLSYYNVHTPITPYRRRIGHYHAKAEGIDGPTPVGEERDARTRLRQDNPAYASMVAAVDDSVGRILSTLDEQGLAEDTVVVFTSDNGGLSTRGRIGPTSNLPLRAGKGWLYEGGIRVPTIVRVPRLTPPGSVCEEPVVSTDFLPTLLELAGVAPPDVPLDGVSLAPLLGGAGSLPPRPLHWHYPHYHGSRWRPGAAIRHGRFKLIEFYETGTAELYDLLADPGERHDLAAARPELRDDLRRRLADWQRSTGARMPVAR